MYGGYGNCGYCQPVCNNGIGGGYALILVLFILSVIIGASAFNCFC